MHSRTFFLLEPSTARYGLTPKIFRSPVLRPEFGLLRPGSARPLKAALDRPDPGMHPIPSSSESPQTKLLEPAVDIASPAAGRGCGNCCRRRDYRRRVLGRLSARFADAIATQHRIGRIQPSIFRAGSECACVHKMPQRHDAKQSPYPYSHRFLMNASCDREARGNPREKC
jgi:hypothetical protein